MSNNIKLEDIYLLAGNITSLDLSNNIKLKTLFLETGNIANLSFPFNSLLLADVSLTIQNSNFNIIIGNANLRKLNCNFTENGNVNLSLFPKLQQINFAGTGLTNLITSNSPMLYEVYVANANLTSIDFSSNLNLETISVTNSNLQTINIDNLQFVRIINLRDNKLASLDCNNLFNLLGCDVGNNLLTSLSLKNGSLEQSVVFYGNQNLQSICCDANETVYVQNQCNTLDYATIVTTNCSRLNLSTENSDYTNNRIALFPNPASNILNIESNLIIDSISISDLNGRLVASNLFDSNKVDVQNLQSGIYFIRIATDSKIETLKFMKE